MALIVLDSVISTMDVAREMVKLGQVSVVAACRTEPGGVMALDQTRGRGQRGRTWYSAPGESLCATYFVPLANEAIREAGKIAILAGAAAANAIEELFGGVVPQTSRDARPGERDLAKPKVGLKWPNDLVISGKKLGGILVEIVPHSNNTVMALVGVGVNVSVRHFPPDLDAISTSLAIEGAAAASLNDLANGIRDNLDRCSALQLHYGFTATIANWRQYDTTVGRRYRAETVNGFEIGEAVEVDSEGALVLRTETGSLLKVLSASGTSEL